MNHSFKNVMKSVFSKLFYIYAVLALFIPDLMIRFLISPKVYGEFFATTVPTAFNLGWICFFLFVCLFILPRKAGRAVYITIGGVFTLFGFSQYIYFGIFEQFYRMSSIGLAGEGGEYFAYAISYLDLRLAVLTVASVLLLILTAKTWKAYKRIPVGVKFLPIIPVLLLVATHIYMQPELFGESDQDWDAWSKPRVVYEQYNDANKCMDISGIYHYAIRDTYKTLAQGNQYSREDFERVERFFEEKASIDKPNDYTGALKGKNLIAIMLEGVDDWMISDKYTPVMKYMMDNGINFSRYYAPTFGTGYTLGSEFCFNTGYFTPISAVSAVNYASNQYPYALPQLFRNAGYTTGSFHYNQPEFYNRKILHNSLGYEKYHSFQDYGLTPEEAQSDSNILKSDEIYADIVRNEPFYSFIITYSGHVPYDYDDAKLALAKANHPDLVDESMDFEENACHILARDTDDFMRMLLERLHSEGKLEDTAILVFTDHYAYGYSDSEKLAALNKACGDDINYRVPAFIYAPGIEPVNVTKPVKTADLLPMVINLFGLEDTHTYIGDDIMSPDYDGFVYFGNITWIDKDMHYIPNSTEVTDGNIEQIDAGNALMKDCRDINDIVIIGDYFDKRQE